tara:strand:- start:21994 stop:22209 length:216 start_codon:yes stop_codon:yes gene_type:complete
LKLFDFNDPFFKPLWIRIAVVAVAVLWGVFEFINGATFWGVLFVALAAVAFHGLFITFAPREPEAKDAKDE